jgi:hypothetical protein
MNVFSLLTGDRRILTKALYPLFTVPRHLLLLSILAQVTNIPPTEPLGTLFLIMTSLLPHRILLQLVVTPI